MQKILIVEDDIDIQDILKNHLIDAGYEVVVASDGVAGIAMFDDTIDLVLLDIMLPKIDGYGVCEVIRKRSQVPIIMLTALSDEENQLRGFEQQITKDNGKTVHIGDYSTVEELDKAISDAVKNGQLTQEEADSVQK